MRQDALKIIIRLIKENTITEEEATTLIDSINHVHYYPVWYNNCYRNDIPVTYEVTCENKMSQMQDGSGNRSCTVNQ